MEKEILLGLIGHPVSHSLSPEIHRAIMASLTMSGDYNLIDVEAPFLEEKVSELKQLGYRGLNVTIPHKINAMKIMDSVDRKAQVAGAINTIHIDGESGRLTGYNTDVDGFRQALFSKKREVECCLIFGLGGAARACLTALADLDKPPKKIYLVGRDPVKAGQLASQLMDKKFFKGSGISPFDPQKERLRALQISPDLFVNASPLGQGVALSERYISLMKEFREVEGNLQSKLVFDLVYSKDAHLPTATVALAKNLGLCALDGFEMLVCQAVKAFEIWTGKSVPPEKVQIR